MGKSKFLNYSFFYIIPILATIVMLSDYSLQTERFSIICFLLITITLTSLIILGEVNSYYFKYIFAVFLLGIYFFSAFPQIYLRKDDYSLQYLVFLTIYFVIFMYKFNPEIFLEYRIKVLSFEKLMLVLFCIFFAISIFFVNLKDIISLEGLSKILLLVISLFVPAYYLPKSLIDSDSVFLAVTKLIFYAGFVTAIYGFLTFFSFITPISGFKNTAVAYFMNPNNTPFLYTFSVPCGLYLYFTKKDNYSFFTKGFIVSIIILMVINVFFTYSRAGIAAIITVIMVYTYFYSKKAFLALLILFVISSILLFKSFIIAKGAYSAFSRAALLTAAIQMIGSSKSGLLFGFGAMSAQLDFKVVMESLNIFAEHINFPHNFIVFYIMQFGLISLIPLIIYVFITIKKSVTNVFRYRNSYYSNILILALSITIGNIVQGLLEDMILFPQYFVFHMALIFLGILIITNKKLAQNELANNAM